MFTEFIRRHLGACRSNEPIFSVAALGKRAEEFTRNVSRECFGLDSFWDRFFRADGVVCNLNLDSASTFLHFVERRCNVSYRYDKPFPGTIVRNGEHSQATAIYFCRDLSNPHAIPSFELIDVLARRAGIVRSEKVGRGEVVAVRAADVVALVERELKTNPWLLTKAGRAEQPA